MSIQAVAGPRLDLDGPPPVAPIHSLLNTPGVVVEEDSGRWLNGVNLIGYPDDVPEVWNACSVEGTFGVKAEGGAGPQSQFDPFVCYLPVTCSALSYPFLSDWSETVLEATYSFAVEQALVGLAQAGLTPNPALGDGNVDVVVAGAKSPAVALSYLENAIGATGRAGMIHASPAVAAFLEPDSYDAPQDGGLYTPNGNRVVAGGGYIGAEANGVAPGAGQDWMFASGPVEVRLSPVFITDLVESLDRSDNTLTFRAERWVLVTWDTALQAAVLVDWDV